jgi:hypothetical protein
MRGEVREVRGPSSIRAGDDAGRDRRTRIAWSRARGSGREGGASTHMVIWIGGWGEEERNVGGLCSASFALSPHFPHTPPPPRSEWPARPPLALHLPRSPPALTQPPLRPGPLREGAPTAPGGRGGEGRRCPTGQTRRRRPPHDRLPFAPRLDEARVLPRGMMSRGRSSSSSGCDVWARAGGAPSPPLLEVANGDVVPSVPLPLAAPRGRDPVQPAPGGAARRTTTKTATTTTR